MSKNVLYLILKILVIADVQKVIFLTACEALKIKNDKSPLLNNLTSKILLTGFMARCLY